MGIQRAPVSLPCVAALILVLGLAILATGRFMSPRWLRPLECGATAAHDAPVEFFPLQRTEMGDRPDCW